MKKVVELKSAVKYCCICRKHGTGLKRYASKSWKHEGCEPKSPRPTVLFPKIERIIERLKDNNPEAMMLPEEFHRALIGVADRDSTVVAVYGEEKCVSVIMESQQLDRDDAEEHFDTNVKGSWFGQHSPVFVEEFL